MNPTLPSICEKIWSIEEDLSLLQWEIDGVHPWPIFRWSVFRFIVETTGLLDAAHPSAKIRPSFLKRLGNQLYYQTIGNPFLVQRNAQAIIIPHERKTEGTDPLTETIIKEIGVENLLIIDFKQKFEKNTLNFRNISKIYTKRHKFSNIKLSDLDKKLISDIRSRISNFFSIDFNFSIEAVSKKVARFKSEREGWSELFTKTGAKKLYLVAGYNRISAVAGAQQAGARVVELQHGIITPFHLGYSWPQQSHVPYYPDELWCFGDYWPQTSNIPKSVRWRSIGAPHVLKLAKQFTGEKDNRLAVFASQGPIGKRLLSLAVDTARLRPDLRVVFRLHPSESLTEYRLILESMASLPDNLSLSQKNPNTYALLAEATYQVGVSSTTLFEGMTLGTKTVVVNLPSFEYLEPAIERGDAVLATSAEEIAHSLNETAPTCSDPDIYYSPAPQTLIA